MNAKLPKASLPIILGVAMVGLVVILVSQWQQLRAMTNQLARSRQQVQQLEAESQQLAEQVKTLEADRQGLDARLKALRIELTTASTNLDRSRHSLEELQQRVETLNRTQAMMEQQLSSVAAERDDARQQAKAMEDSKSELERAVLRLRERLTLLDRDYRQLSEQLAEARAVASRGVSAIMGTAPAQPASTPVAVAALSPGTVELPPIVVRKDSAGMSIPVRGRVVEVNEPHRFIVVDKGSMDGVHVGMAFDIVRAATTIGRATVVRVRPQLSACDILRAQTSGPLQAGDEAVQSSPGSR
jgi:peptidoglycan hydrolase CwlO-like protein